MSEATARHRPFRCWDALLPAGDSRIAGFRWMAPHDVAAGAVVVPDLDKVLSK